MVRLQLSNFPRCTINNIRCIGLPARSSRTCAESSNKSAQRGSFSSAAMHTASPQSTAISIFSLFGVELLPLKKVTLKFETQFGMSIHHRHHSPSYLAQI